MAFTTQKIEPSYIGIVDIWTYKIRVGICKIFNRDVELIGYGEKRQDTDDIRLQEIHNLNNVCENIKIAIEKAEIDAKRKIRDIMINIPTSNLFFESSSYTFHRENQTESLWYKETHNILKHIEKNIFRTQYKKIKNETGYTRNDLKLIISHLASIKLDGKTTKKIIGRNPKDISLSTLNIFMSEGNYNRKDYIAKYTDKNIKNIIPSEFALIGLFSERKNVVMVDIGNTHTSIIVKIWGNIIGAKKLAIGIYDLIKEIRKNHNLTKAEIIRKIDEDVFTKEKTEFLNFFEDILIITLWDIVRFDVCPHDFFMIGGGANNFIKQHLKKIDFKKYDLKIIKPIEYVSPRIDFIDDKITENPAWIDEVKSNMNIYAMIKSTLDFIKKDKNRLEREIKKIVSEIS